MTALYKRACSEYTNITNPTNLGEVKQRDAKRLVQELWNVQLTRPLRTDGSFTGLVNVAPRFWHKSCATHIMSASVNAHKTTVASPEHAVFHKDPQNSIPWKADSLHEKHLMARVSSFDFEISVASVLQLVKIWNHGTSSISPVFYRSPYPTRPFDRQDISGPRRQSWQASVSRIQMQIVFVTQQDDQWKTRFFAKRRIFSLEHVDHIFGRTYRCTGH